MQGANLQTLESELRRLNRDKSDLEAQVDSLTKNNNSLYAELEALRDLHKNDTFGNSEKIRSLEDRVRHLDNEKDMLKDMLNRKDDVDLKYREANNEIDHLKQMLFNKEDLCANVIREKEEIDRQLKFLTVDNSRLNNALSETDGKRGIAEENVRRLESSLCCTQSELETETAECQKLSSQLLEMTDELRKAISSSDHNAINADKYGSANDV